MGVEAAKPGLYRDAGIIIGVDAGENTQNRRIKRQKRRKKQRKDMQKNEKGRKKAVACTTALFYPRKPEWQRRPIPAITPI
jgi:hypothetical protein